MKLKQIVVETPTQNEIVVPGALAERDVMVLCQMIQTTSQFICLITAKITVKTRTRRHRTISIEITNRNNTRLG